MDQATRTRAVRGRRVRVLPADDHSCGWSNPLAPLPPAVPLHGEVRVENAVIGAGYTGLAMARRLTQLRPGEQVVLLDAQRVSDGTSGRNSGFVVDLTDVAAKMRPAVRDGYVRVARWGIDQLRDLVGEHDIDCDWDETGWIRGAAGSQGEAALDPLPALYDEMGMAYEPMDRDAMRSVTGSSFYRRGIRLTGYPLINGAALVRGLAAVRPAEVSLHEESPVTRLERGQPHRLEVAGGRAVVVADRIFLATNGYTPFLGFLSQRIFPLYTFGSLTRPLTAAEQEALGGEREWGILAMDPMGSSVRRTRGQRILIRNTVHYARDLQIKPEVRRVAREENRKSFLARFPQLSEVEFEESWAGLLGSTYNSQINFGAVGHGIYAAAGFTGAGIAMGTAAGSLLVDLALGVANPMVEHLQVLPSPTWLPPDPFRSIGGGWLAERMNRNAEPETL